jgi:hypothetical protein
MVILNKFAKYGNITVILYKNRSQEKWIKLNSSSRLLCGYAGILK